MLEVISIVQLHILVCLPKLMIAILTKWLPFYKKNEFYFAAAAVRGRYRGPGVLGVWTPPFRATFVIPPLNLLEQRYLKLSGEKVYGLVHKNSLLLWTPPFI